MSKAEYNYRVENMGLWEPWHISKSFVYKKNRDKCLAKMDKTDVTNYFGMLWIGIDIKHGEVGDETWAEIQNYKEPWADSDEKAFESNLTIKNNTITFTMPYLLENKTT